MGFLLAGFGLLNLFLGVILFKWVSTMQDGVMLHRSVFVGRAC
jgi:hypothetical protein